MSSSDPVVAVVEKMAGENMRELHELHRALSAFMLARGYVDHKACTNCARWVEQPTPIGGTCGLYNTVPPAKVIASACPAWEDPIPF